MERGIVDEKRELIGGENKNIKGGEQAMSSSEHSGDGGQFSGTWSHLTVNNLETKKFCHEVKSKILRSGILLIIFLYFSVIYFAPSPHRIIASVRLRTEHPELNPRLNKRQISRNRPPPRLLSEASSVMSKCRETPSRL